MEIIGREVERKLLDDRMKSGEAEFVIVYGRRRVGKTYLIRQYFGDKLDFSLTGVYNKPRKVQLSNFASALEEVTGQQQDVPKDWFDAFRLLKKHLQNLAQKERIVVFIDEMPWLETPKSDFLASFEWFWNGWGASQSNLMLIVCGSATTWITDKLLSNKGGLFNRCTLRMYLRPFTLKETELYLQSKGINMSRYDIAECYMVMGGIPFYLKQMSPSMTYNANIDNMFFKPNALLSNEFQALYNTLFSNAEQYIRLVEALATKNMGITRGEIVALTKFSDNGVLSRMLDNLIASDFVMAYNYHGSVRKDTLYQLRDFYTLFYFRFLKNRNGRDGNFWSNAIDLPARKAWAGISFELLCKVHIEQLRRALGIGAVLAECSSWFSKGDEGRGCQIDLLIERRDRVTNICEVKFSSGEYVIDANYEMNLRNKIETFRRESHTRNALHLTMITTYGIKRNSHSGIVQSEVVLDDLFV